MSEDVIEEFIKSDYAREVCRPYASAFLKNDKFFENAPFSIRKLYWNYFFDLIVLTVRETLHSEFNLNYETLCSIVTVDYIIKLNPGLCDTETYLKKETI